MSSATDQIRRLANEPATDSSYTDAELQAKLDNRLGDVNLAAADVWREKAAQYADMVDVTEGNSRRSWSKAYEQALSMAREMENQSSTGGDPVFVPTARMRKITRS